MGEVHIVGPPVGDIPKQGENGFLVISSNHLEGVSIPFPVDFFVFGFKDYPQDVFAHTVHGLSEPFFKLLEIHTLLQEMKGQFQNPLEPFEDLLEHIHGTSPPGCFWWFYTNKTFTILWMVRFVLLGWNTYDKFTLTDTSEF